MKPDKPNHVFTFSIYILQFRFLSTTCCDSFQKIRCVCFLMPWMWNVKLSRWIFLRFYCFTVCCNNVNARTHHQNFRSVTISWYTDSSKLIWFFTQHSNWKICANVLHVQSYLRLIVIWMTDLAVRHVKMQSEHAVAIDTRNRIQASPVYVYWELINLFVAAVSCY